MKLRIWLLCLCLLAPFSFAEDPAPTSGGSEYVEMNPPFIVTFGGPGPLKYLKTEVTLIVPGGESEGFVKLHTPPIRNSLVMLLSRQMSEDVATAEGRDQLRQQALEGIRQVMVEEYGDAGYKMIKDLLFTSFVVQE
ncbi:MAG: flagellar basal body-associated FliL family protein [Motiliproteus sp.]|nr:flagellar basal body-associated FliL family protein [Motiliproteus sp.]MCW9054350.1 flagellar basal body-associated FliL family protein [Motiliproteus sp.]